MKIFVRVLVVLLSLATMVLPTANAAPEGHPDLVQRALAATDDSSIEGWAYTETVMRGGEEQVSRFDPRRPEDARWDLLSIDGRSPTDKERREIADRRSKKRGSSGGDSGGESEDQAIGDMIKPGSLSLIEESAAHAIYSFQPVSTDEGDAKLYEHLDGELQVAKGAPYVASVELRSQGPFKPGFGIKMSEFALMLTFEPVASDGPVLPRSVRIRVAGRAMMVKKIDETVEVRYGDYEYVEE